MPHCAEGIGPPAKQARRRQPDSSMAKLFPWFSLLQMKFRAGVATAMPLEISTSSDADATPARDLGENHAATAGTIHSNRGVGGAGATHCTDRGLPRGCLCDQRSPVSGVDLYRNFVVIRRADGARQDATRSWGMLCLLRRRPRRQHCFRFTAAHFCNAAASIPADIVAGSGRPDADHSSWLEYTGARATVLVLT
jgi:hypothetical protein